MIYVVGIGIEGRKGLGKRAEEIIKRAHLIVGGRRHLEEFRDTGKKTLAIGGNLEEIAGLIERYMQRTVVVLATGDPGLFGIGDFIVRRFGKRRVTIIPGVSILQEAFARIKESMNGLKVISLHGREMDEAGLLKEVLLNPLVAIYTDTINTPSRIAGMLAQKGIKDVVIHVCENIGYRNERITKGSPASIARRRFSPLNVMILRKKGYSPLPEPLTGIRDREISHPSGMITKGEIRAVVLSKLGLRRPCVVWDIGSGCGAVALEVARLIHPGIVYAIEKDKKRVRHIEVNRNRFSAWNLCIVHGTAPEVILREGLPDPDSVFIGGGGRRIKDILSCVAERIKRHGRIVINAVTIDTLTVVYGFFSDHGWSREVVCVNISRGEDVGKMNILKANNPVFIITIEKP